VPALSDNSPAVHYHYHICIDNSAESVGDYKSGSILHNFLDSVSDFSFAVGVNLTGCFIENQD